MSNLSNLLHKFFHNVKLALCESLDIHGGQEHRPIFGDNHELNDLSSLCTSLQRETLFDFQVLLIGSNILSILAFSFCKREVLIEFYLGGT